jgi:hypothetical protein
VFAVREGRLATEILADLRRTPDFGAGIVSAFRKHSEQMKSVFSELSTEELHGLEAALKKIGRRAAALMEQ